GASPTHWPKWDKLMIETLAMRSEKRIRQGFFLASRPMSPLKTTCGLCGILTLRLNKGKSWALLAETVLANQLCSNCYHELPRRPPEASRPRAGSLACSRLGLAFIPS